jgi:protein-disulfide isomerase
MVLPPLDRPVFVDSWRDAVAAGVRIGNPNAPVQIVEFMDLECPFCRVFHREISSLIEKHPNEVSVAFVHFPLPAHRFAMPAARAVECADARGRFAEVVSALFDKQDSIGLKPWGEFASEAGISDTAAFRSCALDATPIKRIEAGKAYGASIQVTGTPTVVINGWRYARSPAGEELEKIVDEIRKGRSPGDASDKRK